MATVTAHQPNVALYAWCRDSDYNYPTSASISIHGVQVSVQCFADVGPNEFGEGTCLYLSSPAKFTVTAIATGTVYTLKGTFGPHSGEIFGSRLGGGDPEYGDTYVLWTLHAGCEE